MNPKDIVRTGYDRISYAYRSDNLNPDDPVLHTYTNWINELIAHIPAQTSVLDIGCGNGIPAAHLLTEAGFSVTGVDLSPVQIARAQHAIPSAHFICADVTTVTFRPHTFSAIVALYAIIHIPLAEQPALLASIYDWLQPGGYLLATVGAAAWTGTEADWLGVTGGQMYWSHADTATYQQWCHECGFILCWTRFIPEGAGGHTLLFAQKPAT